MQKNKINITYDLIEGFRAGQHQCFADVFNLLYASLCQYSFKITRDQSASEDIVEDSFIKIWERRQIFFELNVLKSYLYTTVRNTSLNWTKKETPIQILSDNIDCFVRSDDNDNDNFTDLISTELLTRLTIALNQLSPQGRKIIKKIFFEGKRTKQVAQELGVSQSTIKTIKGRSLIKLKNTIS